MYSLNRAQIIGYVTETPEIRQTGNGSQVTDLNIEIRAKAGETDKVLSSFINATLWRKLAEIAGQYVKKGTQVYISGRLETDSWEDDQGQKKYKTRIVADDLILLSPKEGALSVLPESLEISGGLNKAEVLGNLTKDPELKTTPNGNSVTSFSIATNRQWKDANGEIQDKTEFHNVVAWGSLAEQAAKHLAKGRKVYAAGRVQTRSWETPDGQKRYTTEIVLDTIKSLGHAQGESMASSSQGGESTEAAPAAAKVTNDIPEVNYESEIRPEDLPF